jgi:hypothetical protein
MSDTITTQEIVSAVTKKPFVQNVVRIPDYLSDIRIPGADGTQGTSGSALQAPKACLAHKAPKAYKGCLCKVQQALVFKVQQVPKVL